ncbi:putative syntenin-1 [Apostichopus japonicus]|uniref:Putative syntenin-1 n=1 Tax=Stichopus japonicus TaxID=307972 RepID=A0A2G8KW37_STIJA|nr:putative syntenin-1 [Apostichopus japonicus]
MSLYPSLEDMKVDQMSQAQTTFNQQAHQAITSSQSQPASYASLYPSLTDWMGLDLNSTDISTQLQTQQPPAQSTFERTYTSEDSVGYVGFVFNKGKITAIGKDSSAARNGLLIDQQCWKSRQKSWNTDKKIGEILKNVGQTVTVTVMPNFVFDHMMKNISSSLVKGSMDHSVPEI